LTGMPKVPWPCLCMSDQGIHLCPEEPRQLSMGQALGWPLNERSEVLRLSSFGAIRVDTARTSWIWKMKHNAFRRSGKYAGRSTVAEELLLTCVTRLFRSGIRLAEAFDGRARTT
jgi:hypothetical protein